MLKIRTAPQVRNSLGALSFCDLIPTQYIPGIAEIIKKAGCTEAGIAAATAELSTLGPRLGPVLSILGPAAIVQCVCKGKVSSIPVQQSVQPQIRPQQASTLNSPIIWGSVAVLALGLGLLLLQRKPTKATVVAAPAAAKPSTK